MLCLNEATKYGPKRTNKIQHCCCTGQGRGHIGAVGTWTMQGRLLVTAKQWCAPVQGTVKAQL